MSNAVEYVVYHIAQNGMGHVVFNPWKAQQGSVSQHEAFHTSWAQEIHDNFLAGNLSKPALFPKWEGQTVYIAGRSQSLLEDKETFKKRRGPAIFLNHGVLDLADTIRDGDYMMAIDHGATEFDFAPVAKRLGLITFPGMKRSFIESYPWRDVRGFTFWNEAPMNNWSRRDFPHLPQACECISVAVSAIHLAALSKPKRIVCCGMDFGSLTETKDDCYVGASGRPVWSAEHHARAASAVTFFSRYVLTDGNVEVVNTSLDGLFGKKGTVPWPKGKDWAEVETCPWITTQPLGGAVEEDRRNHV